MPHRLRRSFFSRPTLEVARDLLGMRLVRRVGDARRSGRIVEVEAYIGEEDTACHASRGKTRRNASLFGPPGLAYVYFTYGMHWMLNIVTEKAGFPAAVLLRALEPEEGLEEMGRLRGGRPERDLTRGPARLCQALEINGTFDGADLLGGEDLFVEEGTPVPAAEVLATPRIGIGYAEERDLRAPWRLLVASSPFVSRPPARARIRRASSSGRSVSPRPSENARDKEDRRIRIRRIR